MYRVEQELKGFEKCEHRVRGRGQLGGVVRGHCVGTLGSYGLDDAGKLNPAVWIDRSRTFALADINQAFAAVASRQLVKPLVKLLP